jgi:site-specific recombinase XerD
VELIVPGIDVGWLVDIERDVAFEVRPKNKADRLVLSDRLLEAGLTLIKEAESFSRTRFQRAHGVRNGLMVALLVLHPLRIKNFASLRIGTTFIQIDGRWWLSIKVRETKSHRLDERQVPAFMTDIINRYINDDRPILIGNKEDDGSFWISSTKGRRIMTKSMGSLISKITLQTVGVDVSPHLFRTSAASTAIAYGTKYPSLATGVLGQRDPRVTDEHYIVTTGMQAGDAYAEIIKGYRD